MCDSISESHELNFFWFLIVQTIVYNFDIVPLISIISQVHSLILYKERGGGGMSVALFSQTVAGNLAYWYRSQLFRFSGSGQLEFDLSLVV